MRKQTLNFMSKILPILIFSMAAPSYANKLIYLDKLPSSKIIQIKKSETYAAQVVVDNLEENRNSLLIHQRCGKLEKTKILRNICNADLQSLKINKKETGMSISVQVYKSVNMPLFKKQMNTFIKKSQTYKNLKQPLFQCIPSQELVELTFPPCRTKVK